MLSVQLANVLVKNDVAKVADFGYAREIGTSFPLFSMQKTTRAFKSRSAARRPCSGPNPE